MTLPVYRTAVPADAECCYSTKSLSYEGEEAATLEKIITCINQYPEGFMCMELDNKIIGFINGGCAWQVVMSDEEFKKLIGHDPEAPNAVIMSVVIHPDYQGKGYASLMMKEFITRMKAMNKKTIHLICKDLYVDLYSHFGHSYVKHSESDHGGMTWDKMLMVL